ncbi:hypothetical protein BDZ89DRAFT_1103867 [Hymenopellis radicata]|nr:hypothetical protein BDZ89DRAFT_1103867 [Hymenopellis radicata]
MDGWTKLQSSLSTINFGQSANNVQATRERLGQVAPDEITELPQEYKDLENRVDALRNAHIAMLKITNVYSSESYDYPVQVQESLAELSTTIGAGFQNLASHMPSSSQSPPTTPPAQKQREAPIPVHKTLPHALTRASHSAATLLPPGDRLGKAFTEYATGWDKIAEARIEQDARIQQGFLQGWQTTLTTSLGVAMKARQAVKSSRLELDAAKQTLKNAGPAKQEHARLEVENAEDDLVQKTEVAITLMKTVLENPEPLKNLNELAKAQLMFFATAAEALSGVQGEIEELSVAAEGEYRKSRDH